ncbi:hypothetical protein J0X14_14220 [Muricauda sp. CAU 1633]|uniref:hypothetical protein n=1 Tax=Allomuricauda sp. CAU 1633 TaxID=2816036 RepID=UPI001A8C2A32|nr:hypothetical protein [Muricauda sp. CAU 1633]MBO0323460.1 hypothetical protein [Muricauda sp. CAU 1633]
MDYDTFPFKLFFRILQDEGNVSLIGKSKDENEKIWESIKAEYRERHPSPRERRLVQAYKKVLSESIRANRDITLLRYLLTEPENLEQLYKELKIPWKPTVKERIEYLTLEIDKGKQKLEISNARLKLIEDEIEEARESEEINIAKLNEAIASLTLFGFPINDFEKLTCGQYDAYSKVAQRKANGAK